MNVLTLTTSPNSLVMASNCSSGKLGGRPLIYTFGVWSVSMSGAKAPFESLDDATLCEGAKGEDVWNGDGTGIAGECFRKDSCVGAREATVRDILK